MRTIMCPRCGSSISFRRSLLPGSKPFCAHCGWNLQRAEVAVSGTSSLAQLVPLAIVALALFGAFAALKNSSPWMLVIPLTIGAVVLIPWWNTISTRKALAAAKLTANPSLAPAQPPVDPLLQQMQTMPRPRTVKFRVPRTIITVLVFSVVLLFGTLYLVSQAKPTGPSRSTTKVRVRSNPSGILVVPVVFVVLLVVPYFRDKRNLPLMRDGEMALGKVTYQQNVSQGKSSYSRIGYEFKTSSGQLIQDQAKDLTFSVFEDMTIPVFYDPQNPARNVTPCATYLQVSTNPF
jgi:uncharacterized protein (DUF983 family)